MKKILISAAAAFVMASGPAFAQTTAKTLPDGCAMVTVSQPNFNAKQPNTPILFRGQTADRKSIELCNPQGTTDATVTPTSVNNAVALAVIKMKDKAGRIGLPKNYDEGVADNIYCDVVDGKLVLAYYRIEWSGGLKSTLALADKTTDLPGDIDVHRKKCLDAMPLSRKAELKN